MRSRFLLFLLAALAGLVLIGILLRARLGGGGVENGGRPGETPAAAGAPALEGEDAALPLPDSAARAQRSLAEGATPAPDAQPLPVPDARVDGLVLRPDGKPAALARVQFTQRRADRPYDNQPEDSTVSDEQGLFTINPAPAGHLSLVAMHDDFAPSEAQEFDVAPGEHKRDVRLELREYGSIEGVVLDAHDVPRAGVSVVCEQVQTRKALFAESGPAGRFSFPKVVAGSQWVGFKLPPAELDEIRADAPVMANLLSQSVEQQRVELAPGQTVELVLGGIRSGSVRVFGRVSAGGKACTRTRLWAESRRGIWFSFPRTCTDERGEYELRVAEPGTYTIHVMGQAGALHLTREVAIQEKTEQRVDFELPGGSISGRVVDGAGRPVADVDLSLESLQLADGKTGVAFGLDWGASVHADAEGRFAFPGLPAGRYQIRADPVSRPDADALFGRALSAELELAAGASIAGLEIVLRPGCTVRGVVRGAPEGLARAFYVVAYDESGHEIAGCRVDSDFTFALRGLPEGNFGFRATGANFASPVGAALRVRADKEEQVEIQVVPAVQPLVYPKCSAGPEPQTLHMRIRDERGNVLGESEQSSTPSPQVLWGVLVAPGTYEIELSSRDGWHGRETAVLAAGGDARVEVLLERAK